MGGFCSMIRILALLMFLMVFSSAPAVFMGMATNPEVATNYVDEKFRERAVMLSSHICEVGSRQASEALGIMDAPSKALYTGSVIIKSLNLPNRVILGYGGKYSAIYKLRIAEIYYNKIVEEWNFLYIDSCSVNDDSTDAEIFVFTQKMGEFGGKTSYLILRGVGVEPYKAFMEGAYDMAQDQEVNNKIREQIRTRYGSTEVRIYDSFMIAGKTAGGFVANVAAPVADRIFYEAFGTVGHEMGPQLLKSSVFAEDTFKDQIVPRSKEFLMNTEVIRTKDYGGE